MHKCWSLYNKEDKLRIDDLSKDQVRTILLAIPTSRMRDWYACQEGELHWHNIGDVPEFYEDATEMKGTPAPANLTATAYPKPVGPPEVKRRPLFEEVPDESGDTLKMEAIRTKERRTARRYVRNLMFVAEDSAKNRFECATADVSMSGVSLDKPLPAGLQKNFRAVLELNGQKVKILANRVSDKTLTILEADGWDVLRQWLVKW